MLKNMELTEGVDVFTADGHKLGKINRFIVDPATKEVTHIVVQKGWLLSEDKVVALQLVSTATENHVVLNSVITDFDQLPPFEESYFVQTPNEDLGRSEAHPTDKDLPMFYYWNPPQVSAGYPPFVLDYFPSPQIEIKRNIPEETIALKDGTSVISSDGKHIGHIERMIIEPELHKATHLVVTHGTLFKQRKLIPTQWVKSIEEDKVYLLISSKVLTQLRDYEP